MPGKPVIHRGNRPPHADLPCGLGVIHFQNPLAPFRLSVEVGGIRHDLLFR
jgi:hypothetical protein